MKSLLMKWFVVDKRIWNTGLQYFSTRVSCFEYSQWLLTWAAILREKFINATNTNVVTQATIRAPCCGWFFPLCRRILLARYHVPALGPMRVQHCCTPPDVVGLCVAGRIARPSFFLLFSEDDWGVLFLPRSTTATLGSCRSICVAFACVLPPKSKKHKDSFGLS